MVSEEDVWFSSPSHRQVSAKLAAVCSAGVMPCEQAVPVTWQLIRGAAVADPGVLPFLGAPPPPPLPLPFTLLTPTLPPCLQSPLCHL